MTQIKLTKNELRDQEMKLHQLSRYLPTLQLKKVLIQTQVTEARYQVHELMQKLEAKKNEIAPYATLLKYRLPPDTLHFAQVKEIHKHYENIAGADVPVFDEASFPDLTYNLFDTPLWLEGMIFGIRALSTIRAKIITAEEKKLILEKEFREVSIRVNLFEKVLIPRCEKNIKSIKIFLGDLSIASIGQAKVAKDKIERAKQIKEREIL
jgi:V/A-type H+/Na+-transporting ATPase subunit D